MATDTNIPSASREGDSLSHTDHLFDAHETDSLFSAVQVAQAAAHDAGAAPGAPQPVEIPAGASVVRIPVTAGEVLELGAPFTGEASLIGRVGDGNLAIKVGDVTVILQGYVDANSQAPITVETSDGKPIDVATMLASTDPTLDIQTAAGPNAVGAQGADNTGAILAQFGPGGGLGGFSAVGAQDGTSLTYGLIDNSIRQELAAAPLLGSPFSFSSSGPLGPLDEGFLRDPVNSTIWSNYQDFASHYFAEGQANWADFFGTLSDAPDYLESLHQQAEVTASSAPATVLLTGIANIGNLTSDGSALHVSMADGNETAFIYRDADGALVAVVHVTVDPTAATTFHIDTYLINRLDDLDADGNPTDSTSLDVNFNVYSGEVTVDPEQEGQQLPSGGLPGTASFLVADDAPLMDPHDPSPDTVTEGEKVDTVTGTFNFNFGADGPLDAPLVGGESNDVVSLLSSFTAAVELGLKVSDPDNGNTTYLQFENGALVSSKLTSGGHPVDVAESHDGFGHTVLTGSIDGGATTIFTITVTDTTGAWTFQLDGALDHPGKGEVGANDQFQFDLTATITDDDLDAASGSETFFVNDSGATVVPPPPPQGDDQDPASYSAGTLVYESALATGSDPAANTETTTGTVTIAAPDGISAITVAGVAVDLNTIANTPVIHGTYGDLTITAWNPATGTLDFSYTLLKSDPNHSSATGNDIVQGEDFSVVATDGDGDPTSADIKISIVDDVPNAVDDPLGTVLVDGTAQVVANILTNDSNGADGSTTTIGNVTGATATATGWDIVEADGSGTVHVGKDGTVTFTANPAHDFTAGDPISFDYTIVDGDGDTSTATVTFTAAVRGTTMPSAADLAVDESKLPDGSQGGGGSLTDTKTVTLPDGFAVDAADLGDHALPNGTLHVSQAGQVVTYTYTLNSAYDGATSDDARNVVDGADSGNTFTLHVSGPFGQTGTVGLDVTIKDDIPTAKDDPLSTVLVDGTAQLVGNILANDSNGADGGNGPKTISDVAGSTATATGWDIVEADGSGTVHVAKDGTVTFTANTSHDFTAGDNISFDYTIVDGDGDTSTATVTFTAAVRGTAMPSATNLAVDESKLPTGSQAGGGSLTDSKTVTLPPGFAVNAADLGNHTLPNGTLNVSQVGQVVTYTYTLNSAYNDGTPNVSDGRNVVDGADSGNTFTLHVSGPFGQTGTVGLDVTIKDDVPTAFDPNDQSMMDHAGDVITGVLNAQAHAGADGVGSIVFSGGTDGSQAFLADGTTPMTWQGNNVLLSGFGTETLTGYVDTTANGKVDPGEAVFTVKLDGTTDTYTFSLLKSVDDGDHLTFTDLGSVRSGNNAWIGGDSNSSDPNSEDLLYTARDFGSGDHQQVNRSNNGVSIDDNNGIGSGQGVRLDFVKGLTGSPSTVNGFNFSGHYQVQDFQISISKVQGNAATTTSVKLTAMDVTDTGVNGSGTTESDFLAGAIVALTSGEVKVFNSGGTEITGSVTFTYNADGTVVVAGLHEGDVIKIHESTGFDRLSIDSTGGADFLVANALVTQTVSGHDLDMKFQTTLTDGDGDKAAGNYIGINLQTDDGQNHTFNGGPGNDTIHGDTGTDLIFGNAGNDTLFYDAKDTLNGGAGFDRVVVEGGGHAVTYDGARFIGIEMADLGDASDRSGNHNTLALKADDLVGSSSAATIGPVGSSHDINFFIIGDDKGATSADRDGVHLTTGFGAGPAPIATGIAYVDPVTGISHNFDVYQSTTHPEIKVAIEHGLDVTT